MPLSRHFYELDEVEAALSYCCTRNDVKESVFWCQEMLQSGCASEAISCLFQTWLWDKGPFALGWLLGSGAALSADELTEDAVLLATDRLRSAYATHDHSLWNILFLQRTTALAPDRITPKPLPAPPPSLLIDTLTAEELFFVRACAQGKAQSAWWMASQLPNFWHLLHLCIGWIVPEDQREATRHVIELLQRHECLLGYTNETVEEVIRCMAVLVLCLSPTQRAKSLLCGGGIVMDSAAAGVLRDGEWLLGRVGFRRYSVPVACLYGRTARGKKRWTDSTLHHLSEIEPRLKGCPFWEDVLAPFLMMATGDGVTWASDDAMETFYDTYFPDDIPDEWTLAEKKKSHGDGVLGPNDRVMLAKYVRLHLSRTSRLAWNTGPKVYAHLERMGQPMAHGATLIEIYGALPLNEKRMEPSTDLLRPLRRQLIFAS